MRKLTNINRLNFLPLNCLPLSFLQTSILKISAISCISLLGLVACGNGGSGGGSHSSATSTVASSSSSSSSSNASSEGMTMLHADGTKWVKASGTQIILRGTNLGNWLVQEFWMMGQGGNGVTDQCTLENKLTERFTYSEKERLMKLYHDSWITERDWDVMKDMGLNLIRIPLLWSLIEDEKNPRTLRSDAWTYIDQSIAAAKARNMYVILDLHGVVGGQGTADHTGCAGQNKYWTTTDYQDRTNWLWEQIATRYKDEPAVAAYGPYNEPWGSTPEDMATHAIDIYNHIRTVDTKHIVLMPGYYSGIDAYTNTSGLSNYAFEMHFYPGIFDGNKMEYNVHRDWLRCGPDGKGGVCDWDAKIKARNVPFLIGEFQPWQSMGLELGGKVARATYDTYASYGWASTNWAYKYVSIAGGQGTGTWGMVTNAINTNSDTGVGLVAKASTWDCSTGWDSTFANACAKKASTITVGGTGSKTYYFVIKTGASSGSDPDVTYDKISIINNADNSELIVNGNFGSNTGWTVVNVSNSEDIDFNYTTSGKTPTGSEGAVLHIGRPSGVTGEINAGVYQAITLQGGQTYTFSGVFKSNASANTWAEMYLIDAEPVAGKDIIDMTGKVDFATASITDIENLFKSYATQEYDVHAGLKKYLFGTPTTLFTLPARPTGLQATQGTGSVALAWTANAESDVTGYRVYRSTTPGSGYTLLADNVASNNYTDSTAVDGTTYYYTVSAIDADDESYRSAEVANIITYAAIPGTVEAESYSSMSGIQTETCTDTGGGFDVGYFDTGDSLEYNVTVTTAGTYQVEYRLASQVGSTGFDFLVDGTVVDTQAVANTGGWQSWVSVTSGNITLSAGNHTLRFNAKGGSWNINWFKVKAM